MYKIHKKILFSAIDSSNFASAQWDRKARWSYDPQNTYACQETF